MGLAGYTTFAKISLNRPKKNPWTWRDHILVNTFFVVKRWKIKERKRWHNIHNKKIYKKTPLNSTFKKNC